VIGCRAEGFQHGDILGPDGNRRARHDGRAEAEGDHPERAVDADAAVSAEPDRGIAAIPFCGETLPRAAGG
jgi:hypothetical protein